MKFIDKIAFICLRNKKALCTLSKGKDTFYIPGGKREAGESDIATLVREVKEELSVDIIPGTAKLYGVFLAQAHGEPAGVMVQATCYTADFTSEIKANSEIAEAAWLDSSDMGRIGPVAVAIFNDLKAKNLLN